MVSGQVQGVGYRWYVLRCAQTLGLAGWVRNHWNGTVEGEAEGTEKSLADFTALLEGGPENPARVEKVETRPVAPKGRDKEAGFDVAF